VELYHGKNGQKIGTVNGK